jgi:hypothetical protein
MVADDADRHAIPVVTEDGDEILGNRGISSRQGFQELPVPINSRRIDAWILPAASEEPAMPSIAIQCSGRFGARVRHARCHLHILGPHVVSRAESCARTEPGFGAPRNRPINAG